MEKETNKNIPQEGDFKIKKKPKKYSNKQSSNAKIDLKKAVEENIKKDAIPKLQTGDVD